MEFNTIVADTESYKKAIAIIHEAEKGNRQFGCFIIKRIFLTKIEDSDTFKFTIEV